MAEIKWIPRFTYLGIYLDLLMERYEINFLTVGGAHSSIHSN